MQFSSSARPSIMNYAENMHESSSNSKRLFGSISMAAGNSKGLENNISGMSNNISGNHNGDSNNSMRNSNLGQVNVFRPDPHEQPSPTAAMPTGATAAADKNTSMQKANDKVPHTTSGSPSAAKYKECLKNHAANMGGYAVDGCGEFMPSGKEGSLEALKCAACGCHRNFHRREINGASSAAGPGLGLLALPSPVSANNNSEYGEAGDHHSAPAGGGHHSIMGFSPGHLHHHHHHQYMAHTMMGGKPGAATVGGGHQHQHQHHHGMHLHQYGQAIAAAHHQHHYHGSMGGGMISHGSAGGKRFRTKFSMEQREKMYEFSEKVGWRIQKQDETLVQQFCAEVGVKRHVLKVWMHNNKNTFGKKLLRFPEAFNPSPAEPSTS